MGKNIVVVPAGGSGKRFGADIPKQYIKLNGKEIIIHTLEKFQNCEFIDEIIVVCHKDWIDFTKKLSKLHSIDKLATVIIGGNERQDSVYNALRTEIAQQAEIILVHDAVRPFIDNSLIEKLINTAQEYGAAIPCVKPKSTVKIRKDDEVEQTLDRNLLVEVQTPQVFQKEIIINAYDLAYKNNYYGTDSSSLIEYYGKKVKIIESNYENIKITSPFDIEIAKAILYA